MTLDTAYVAERISVADRGCELDLDQGWQALAIASLGRPLSATEIAVAELVPAELALDLFFPDLGDAARHEALSTLGP